MTLSPADRRKVVARPLQPVTPPPPRVGPTWLASLRAIETMRAFIDYAREAFAADPD